MKRDFLLHNLNFCNTMPAGVLYKKYLVYNRYNFLSIAVIVVNWVTYYLFANYLTDSSNR